MAISGGSIDIHPVSISVNSIVLSSVYPFIAWGYCLLWTDKDAQRSISDLNIFLSNIFNILAYLLKYFYGKEL
jgi:hypothetical protein